MARKIILVIAALILPGGLIALFAALALKAFRQGGRDGGLLARAMKRVPAWATPLAAPAFRREAA